MLTVLPECRGSSVGFMTTCRILGHSAFSWRNAVDSHLLCQLCGRHGHFITFGTSSALVHSLIMSAIGLSRAGCPTCGELSAPQVVARLSPYSALLSMSALHERRQVGRVAIRLLRLAHHCASCVQVCVVQQTARALRSSLTCGSMSFLSQVEAGTKRLDFPQGLVCLQVRPCCSPSACL